MFYFLEGSSYLVLEIQKHWICEDNLCIKDEDAVAIQICSLFLSVLLLLFLVFAFVRDAWIEYSYLYFQHD